MSRRVDLLVRGTPEQVKFWRSRAKYRAFVGGIGSGKTYAGAIEALSCPPTLGCIVAPTYPMLRDATARMFRDLAERTGTLVSWKQGEMRAQLSNGAEVLMRSADEPDRLRGLNLGWVWLDEPAEMKDLIWSIMLGRLRLAPGRMWATGTPKGFTWLYDRFVRRATREYDVIHARTESNVYLDPDYLRSVREDYSGKWAQQELDGMFVDMSGGVFERSWFNVIDPRKVPDVSRWCRYYDLAASTRTHASRTATCAVGQHDRDLYIRDMHVGRWEWPDQRKLIGRLMLEEPRYWHGIEKALHGLAAVQELRRDERLSHVYMRAVDVPTDKLSRALVWQARAENGHVHLVDGSWVPEFLSEVSGFTGKNDAYDDQVDAVSGAVQMIGLRSRPQLGTQAAPVKQLRRGRFAKGKR